MKIAIELTKFILWSFLRLVFLFMRRISWSLTGVTKQLDTNGNSYQGNNIHIRKIWLKYNFDPVLMVGSEVHFITTHERFEHPAYLLRPNVTLYGLSEREAYFVETDGKNVLNSDHGGFVKFAQYRLAVRFIVVPLRVCEALCESLPEPARLVVLGNTARCGSTMLTQVSGAVITLT